MPRNRFFTPAQANAMLPLVRRIVTDITTLAHSLREKHQRIRRLTEGGSMPVAHEEELFSLESQLEQGQEQMEALEQELGELGILLKDYFIGLIDFPCWRDEHEVYLCWKLGEPEVAHWHEIDAGFSGRKKLMVGAQTE
jgi:hypothetical protein